MAKQRSDTWMPLYIGDYLRKTMHLTAEQHGVYLLLIMACWVRGGALPNDDSQLAATARIGLPQWRKVRPVIAPFFQIADDGWRNNRVTEELANSDAITEQRRNAGRASAAAKWQREGNEKSTGVATEPITNAQQNDRPSPSPSPEERNTPPTPRKRRGVSLAGFEEWWEGYPHKVGKGAAEKAWPKALALASLTDLVDGVERYRRAKPPDREWVGPAVWLNQKRWLDQPATAEVVTNGNGKSSSGPDGPPPTGAELLAIIERREMGLAR